MRASVHDDEVHVNLTAGHLSNCCFVLTDVFLLGKIMQSVMSLQPSVSTLSFETVYTCIHRHHWKNSSGPKTDPCGTP